MTPLQGKLMMHSKELPRVALNGKIFHQVECSRVYWYWVDGKSMQYGFLSVILKIYFNSQESNVLFDEVVMTDKYGRGIS